MGKSRVMKKQINIGTDPSVALSRFLKRFEMPDTPELKGWANGISEDKLKPEGYYTEKYWREVADGKTIKDQPPLHKDLEFFKNYCCSKMNIVENDQRAYYLSVIKPTDDISKKKITIDCGTFIVSDRFILIGGSREFMSMEPVDLSKMKMLSNLAPKQKMMDAINVPVKQNEIIHLEMLGAVSMKLAFNNQKHYRVPEKKGFRAGGTMPKSPANRYIIVLDIIAPSEKVKNSLREQIGVVDEISDDKSNPELARMATEAKNVINNIDGSRDADILDELENKDIINESFDADKHIDINCKTGNPDDENDDPYFVKDCDGEKCEDNKKSV